MITTKARHVGGALHSNSKGQTMLEESGSLLDLQPSTLRMEYDDDVDDHEGVVTRYPGQLRLIASIRWEMCTGQRALQLESQNRYGSFHLWINVWVTGKTV